MPKIVIVEKSGNLKTVQLKDLSPESVFKKLAIKSAEGFKLQHTWGQEDGLDENISLYAKTEGRAGQENKYDFPPPVDEKLFFGPCALVGRNAETGEPVDLDEGAWEEIYEFLFGGFDDVGSEDSEEDVDTEDELANLKASGVEITKQGYAKDGFIVESDEEEEEEEEEEESEEESEESEEESEEEEKPKQKAKPKPKPKPKAAPKPKKEVVKPVAKADKKKAATVFPVAEPITLEDCGDELSVESYD